MDGRSQIACIRVHPLAIPLRKAFRHAAHERQTADPVVVAVELADGTIGYGETLPREYVSGETVETVIDSIRDELAEEVVSLRPESFPEALERIDALPMQDESGRGMTAARAALELALLDAYSRHFGRPIGEAVGWLGLPGFGTPGSIGQVRYSGVLSGGSVGELRGSVRKMRLFGLADFKLKVGYIDDLERIREVASALKLQRALLRNPNGTAGELAAGLPAPARTGFFARFRRPTTLRLDANGAWSVDDAAHVLRSISDVPIASIEQPLSPEHPESLVALKRLVSVPVMHDESLVTPSDAERLVELGVADAFNIRISKNGGFLAAVRLAHFARKNGVMIQLGCMVGETSILSAAGRHFLENVPGVRFAEGSYGSFLLRGDVVSRPLRFGWGGKPRAMTGLGWGIDVRPELLTQWAADRPSEIRL